MHSFLVLILGFLFVSFHPSRFRSHSCSTGASLCPLPCVRFFVGIFCLPSAFFRPLQPASDYSAFCTFFSLLPDFPHAAVLISAYLPHLSSLFPCFPSDCGTQRSAIPFSDHCFVSQNYFNVSAFSLRKSADFPWLAL
jgi:hypothetical protein